MQQGLVTAATERVDDHVNLLLVKCVISSTMDVTESEDVTVTALLCLQKKVIIHKLSATAKTFR